MVEIRKKTHHDMAKSVENIVILLSFKIKTMTKEQNNPYIETVAVSHIEHMAYEFRDAIVDGTSKLPFISSFKHYIELLQTQESLIYVGQLLYECWCLANPLLRVNQPIDPNMDLKKFLADAGLKRLSDEMDKGLIYQWVNALKDRKDSSRLTYELENYRKYLLIIHSYLKAQMEAFGLELYENFTVGVKIITRSFDTEEINALTDYLEQNRYITKEDRANFIACFGNTINIPTGSVKWTDIGERNKSCNIVSLYNLLKTLGVDITKSKDQICRIFTKADGSRIDPTQLKARGESEKSSKFVSEIKQLIGNN